MTDGTSRMLAALFAALACAAGGLAAFELSMWMPPRPPDLGQVLSSLRSDDPTTINSALPADVTALVFRPSGPGADRVPADGQEPAPPSAPPREPAIPPVVWAGRVVLVSNPTDYDAELARMSATSVVAQRPGPDGNVLVVATPRTDRSKRTAAAVAGVAVLTGALAALAIVLLWPTGRRESTALPPDEPTSSHAPRWRPPDPAPVPVGAGAPDRGVGVPPGPDGQAAVPFGTDRPAPDPAVASPAATAPPDPLPELRTQRATLIRGLADLADKLPAEYEWQAANVLDAAGVRRVTPDGDAFDPAIHYAVDTVPTPDVRLDDTVARTLRPGWADGNQVVLPARVVVYAVPTREGGPDDGAH